MQGLTPGVNFVTLFFFKTVIFTNVVNLFNCDNVVFFPLGAVFIKVIATAFCNPASKVLDLNNDLQPKPITQAPLINNY